MNVNWLVRKVDVLFLVTCGYIYMSFFVEEGEKEDVINDSRSLTLQSKIKKDLRISLIQIGEDEYLFNANVSEDLHINMILSYNKYLPEIQFPVHSSQLLTMIGVTNPTPLQQKVTRLQQEVTEKFKVLMLQRNRDFVFKQSTQYNTYKSLREFSGNLMIPIFYKKFQQNTSSNKVDSQSENDEDVSSESDLEELADNFAAMEFSLPIKKELDIGAIPEPTEKQQEKKADIEYPDVPFGGKSLEFKGIGGHPFGRSLN